MGERAGLRPSMSLRNFAFVGSSRDVFGPPPDYPHACGTLSGPESHHCRLVYSDSKCSRCGHAPCPCCGKWCDVLNGAGEFEGDLCCGGECAYEHGRDPKFVDVDLQWVNSIAVCLDSLYLRGKMTKDALRLEVEENFDEASGYWRLGMVRQSTRLFAAGDAAVVVLLNGQGERQPVFGVSSKGRTVGRGKRSGGFYMRYARHHDVGGRSVQRRDNSPLFLPELPGEVAKLSPLDPAFSAYVRQLRAEVLKSEVEVDEPPYAPQPEDTLG